MTDFTAEECTNLVRIIEIAFNSGLIKSSQDATIALMLQQKCASAAAPAIQEDEDGTE